MSRDRGLRQPEIGRHPPAPLRARRERHLPRDGGPLWRRDHPDSDLQAPGQGQGRIRRALGRALDNRPAAAQALHLARRGQRRHLGVRGFRQLSPVQEVGRLTQGPVRGFGPPGAQAHIIEVASTLLEDGAAGIVPAKDDGDVPMVRAYNTDAEEAQHVATWLSANHQPGTTWRSMAVLARTNAQLEVVAGYLDAAGIPNERRGPEHSPASDLFVAADTSARRADDEQNDAVALSTIHRAKGQRP